MCMINLHVISVGTRYTDSKSLYHFTVIALCVLVSMFCTEALNLFCLEALHMYIWESFCTTFLQIIFIGELMCYFCASFLLLPICWHMVSQSLLLVWYIIKGRNYDLCGIAPVLNMPDIGLGLFSMSNWWIVDCWSTNFWSLPILRSVYLQDWPLNLEPLFWIHLFPPPFPIKSWRKIIKKRFNHVQL